MARKPAKRAKTPSEKRAEDKRASVWFDAGVGAFGKADAYADELVIDKSELSKMRAGDTVALRRLLPMQKHAPSALAFVESFMADVELAEHPDELLAVVCPWLESIGFVARPADPEMTYEELGVALLDDFNDGSAVTRQMIENVARKRGAGPRQVALVLQKRNEKP